MGEMIKFDLEKFKAGAVAVDENGREHNPKDFTFRPNSMESDNVLLHYSHAEHYWHMKESKWIVYREFESEEEAELFAEVENSFKEGDTVWKIKEV